MQAGRFMVELRGHKVAANALRPVRRVFSKSSSIPLLSTGLRSRLLPAFDSCTYLQHAQFSDSAIALKKSSAKQEASAKAIDELYDLTILEKDISSAQDKLRDQLAKIRPSGRLQPEVIENLRVQSLKDAKEKVLLSQLAQVIPRGRQLQIFVGEKEHIKAIMSAVSAAGLNLTAQPDQQQPLQLNITIPAPTTEARQKVVEDVKRATDAAVISIQAVGRAQKQKLQKLSKQAGVPADDPRKAQEKMEKTIKDGQAEVKKTADAMLKALERR